MRHKPSHTLASIVVRSLLDSRFARPRLNGRGPVAGTTDPQDDSCTVTRKEQPSVHILYRERPPVKTGQGEGASTPTAGVDK